MGSNVCAEQDLSDLNGEAVTAVNGLRYAIAGRAATRQRLRYKLLEGLPPVIGTSYPNATRAFFDGNVVVKFVKGSTEVLPYLLPEVDGICDLVETGNSLRENGLEMFMDNVAPVNLILLRQPESVTI